MLIKVDTQEVLSLSEKGGELVFNPKAEEALEKLLKLRETIDLALNHAKGLIEEAGLKYNSNFTSVQSSKIKALYRHYGGRYAIEEDKLDKLPRRFYKVQKRYVPISEAIDKWTEKTGSLPLGIKPRPRSKQISLKLINHE